jgi:hypothetical protein
MRQLTLGEGKGGVSHGGLAKMMFGGGIAAGVAAVMAVLAAYVVGDVAAAYLYQFICNSSKAIAWMFNNVLRARFGVSFGEDFVGICKVPRPPHRMRHAHACVLFHHACEAPCRVTVV